MTKRRVGRSVYQSDPGRAALTGGVGKMYSGGINAGRPRRTWHNVGILGTLVAAGKAASGMRFKLWVGKGRAL